MFLGSRIKKNVASGGLCSKKEEGFDGEGNHVERNRDIDGKGCNTNCINTTYG